MVTMLSDTSLHQPSKRQVLLTGVAGFIGSNLAQTLLTLGYQVTGVDNFLTGQELNLLELKNYPQFRFIQADVTQPPESYLPRDFVPDLVLHFASPASPPRYQKYPVETYLVNSWATHQLLEWLKTHHPKATFLFAGTSEAYGVPLEHPQKESYWGNVNPNGIRSCYDESKRLAETICGVFHREMGLDTRIVRIFNTYGPHMDPTDGRVIPQFISEALAQQPLTIYGDGSQTRSYCFVDDLVEGILALAEHPQAAGETVNLGNPVEMTISETAASVFELVANRALLPDDVVHLPLPGDDPTRRQPDISKARQLLQWQPKTDFKSGILSTIEYFKKVLAKN